METNGDTIKRLLDYIEENIEEDIVLDELADLTGYSPYHLHRMFTGLVGFSVHQYIIRRKITESARRLITTSESVIQIALDAGYESQQAFTLAFKRMYKMTPGRYRRTHQFIPIQLKFDMDSNLTTLKGDRIMEIKTVDSSEILIAGYKADTGKGFFVIPRLWKRIHKVKHKINNRIDKDFLIGLNDYRDSDFESFAPTFTYYAGTQISDVSELNPKLKLEVLEIPASSYVVFTYYGRSEDSIQSVMDYIYKQWFPMSDCQFNEEVKMDFVRYGELPNEKGLNRIEVWIPINQVI